MAGFVQRLDEIIERCFHPGDVHLRDAVRHVPTVTGSRALSDSSTGGGTRRATSPPRRKTSLTSREDTYVYSTAGSMKIVSMFGLSSRFMSAICSSYS